MARKSTAARVQSDSVKITMSGGATTALNLFAGLVREKALRSATYAGAKVLYEEMCSRAAAVNKSGESSGQLRNAIYHWHDEKQSGLDRQVYLIGVNKKKAPHWHLIEYGHWMQYQAYIGNDGKWHTVRRNGKPVLRATPKKIPATPYVRPTWDAQGSAAVDAVKLRLSELLKEGR